MLFMFPVCHAFLSVHCSIVVTCWERADLFALLCVMLFCVFDTFLCGVLTVSIPDLCLLTYHRPEKMLEKIKGYYIEIGLSL